MEIEYKPPLDSSPTPITSPTGLGWKQLRDRCIELSEALHARAAWYRRERIDIRMSNNCERVCEDLKRLAAAWERLVDVHIDSIEHRRNQLWTCMADLSREADQMLL